MTDGTLPLALRELRTNLTSRPALVGMLGLGVILGISGPFDTYTVMGVVPRMMYWTFVVVLTYCTGSLVSTLIHRALNKRSIWLALVVSTVAIGTVITGLLSLINLGVFGINPKGVPDFFSLWAIVTLISAVVEIGLFVLRDPERSQATPSVPLMERLPFEKRGALVALSAEDHYVNVTTDRGSELILLRLSDAIKEVGPTQGLQIHRSHWVALDQIRAVERLGERGEVVLVDETKRPISRGFMPAVRQAGLLPQKPA